MTPPFPVRSSDLRRRTWTGHLRAAIAGLGGLAVLATGPAADGAYRPPDEGRRFVPFEADTLWIAGGTPSDTSLLIPIATAVGDEALYVIDRGEPRVAAFDLRDGRLLWLRGRRGGGPTEFMNPTALDIAGDGTLMVADARNARIARLRPDGSWLPSLPLRGVSYVNGLCMLPDDGMLMTTMADSAPVLVLDGAGEPAQRLDLPWPDLVRTAGLVVQAAMARSADGRDCYLGLYLGRGFARWSDGGFRETVPYVEYFDLPGADVSSSGNRTVTRLTDSRVALGDVAVTDSTVVFAFRGMSEHRNRILDVYGRDGRYHHSYRFRDVIMGVDYGDGVYYLRSRRNDYPAVYALRIRPRAR